jgi:hypothetical protein
MATLASCSYYANTMAWFLGVIGLRSGAGRRSFSEVRRAADADLFGRVEAPLPPAVEAAPATVAAAQEARAAAALSAVVGKKR